MRHGVLLLDDDLPARKVLGSVLSAAGYPTTIVDSIEDARALLGREIGALVVAGESGLALLRQVRKGATPNLHVIMLTAGGRRQEIVDALEAGADDVLQKPIAPEVLLGHLAAAERGRAQRTSFVEAVREASRQGDGELVVRSGQVIGRVFFHEGDLVWLALPGRPSALEAALGAVLRDRRDEARAIFDECRRTGQAFDEVIAALGLVPAEIVARRLRRWLIDGFEELQVLPDPECLFLPGKMAFAGGHRVPLSVVLDDAPSSVVTPLARTVPPPERHLRCDLAAECRGCGDDVHTTIRRLLELEAVLGAAVVHSSTGQPIGAGGVAIDPDVLATQLRTLRALPRDEQPAELLLTGATTLHLAHSTSCESAMVCVLAQRKLAPLALLRVSVSRVVRELAAPCVADAE